MEREGEQWIFRQIDKDLVPLPSSAPNTLETIVLVMRVSSLCHTLSNCFYSSKLVLSLSLLPLSERYDFMLFESFTHLGV